MELRPILRKKVAMKDRITPFTAAMSALGFILGGAIVIYFLIKLLH